MTSFIGTGPPIEVDAAGKGPVDGGKREGASPSVSLLIGSVDVSTEGLPPTCSTSIFDAVDLNDVIGESGVVVIGGEVNRVLQKCCASSKLVLREEG